MFSVTHRDGRSGGKDRRVGLGYTQDWRRGQRTGGVVLVIHRAGE